MTASYHTDSDGITRKDVEDLLVGTGISASDAPLLVDATLDMAVAGGSSVETAATAIGMSVQHFNYAVDSHLVLGEN